MGNASSSSFRAQRLGRYQIKGELGQGAFGSVFRAHDPQLNRDVAIKLLVREDARSAKRFEREIQAAAKLRHPNIVSVHESGEYQGRPYLVMEYVDGEDLEALARGDRPLATSRAVEIVRDAARAIEHAHEQQVLHRDIKPPNILVDRAGSAHVVDFGLAALRDANTERLSHTGLPLGTPAFMAPEQMRGEQVDEQADVYGLGATLYYALCGQPPRGHGVSPFASSAARTRIEPPSAIDPRVPRELDAICLEALQDEPWERFEGAGELADALDGFLRGDAPVASARRRGGSPWLLPLLALTIAVLGGLLALLVTRPAPARPVAGATPAGDGAGGGPDAPTTSRAEAERLLEEARAAMRQLASVAAVRERLEAALAAAAGYPDLLERAQLWELRFFIHRSLHPELLARVPTLAERPGDVGHEARALRMITLFRLRREEEGQAAAEALVRDVPEGVWGHVARASLAGFVRSDMPAVERHAREALKVDPNNHCARLQLGMALLNTGKSREGREVFASVIDGERCDDAHAYVGLTVGLLNTRSSNRDSLESIERALQTLFRLLEPRVTAAALRTRGHALLFTQRPREAIADLERAVKKNPRDTTSILLLGLAHDQLEDFGAARQAFRRAYATDRQGTLNTVETLKPLALRMRVARDLGLPPEHAPAANEAMRAWMRARLERVAAAARPHVQQVLEQMQRGLPWGALEAGFDRAQRAAPDDPGLAWFRAEAQLGRGDEAGALREVRRARRLGAKSAQLDFVEAEACFRAAERARGMKMFRQVVAADPQGVLGRSAQAFLDWQTDAKPEPKVIEDLARLTQEAAHVPSLVLLSVLLRGHDRYAEALQATSRARALVGFLNPWVMGQHALSRLALRFEEQAPRAKLDAAFLQLEDAMRATNDAGLRLMATNFACRVAARRPKGQWAHAGARWSFELREQRVNSAETYLLSGWLAMMRGKQPEEVLRHWRGARQRGLKQLPPPLTKAFQKRFGRPPSF